MAIEAPGFKFNQAHQPPQPQPSLGPLADFHGRFVGSGFNTIFRPQNSASPTPLPVPQPDSDNILELNLTSEVLEFSPPLGSVPNRGEVMVDLFLNGVPYLQRITDVTDPRNQVGIHFEPGLWMIVPATTDPVEGVTLARMASIPHGTTINAQGTFSTAAGPPNIPTVSITPFVINRNPPQLVPFPSQKVVNQTTARIPQNLAGINITQTMLDDPNSVLRDALAHDTVTETTTISIATNPPPPPQLFGGGTANIAFLLGDATATNPNANAIQMSATFWIEKLQGGLVQLQYSQLVILNFRGLSWPHCSVATLRRS